MAGDIIGPACVGHVVARDDDIHVVADLPQRGTLAGGEQLLQLGEQGRGELFISRQVEEQLLHAPHFVSGREDAGAAEEQHGLARFLQGFGLRTQTLEPRRMGQVRPGIPLQIVDGGIAQRMVVDFEVDVPRPPAPGGPKGVDQAVFRYVPGEGGQSADRA